MDANTSRGLTFDGGGGRGYFSLCLFENFLHEFNIPESQVTDIFGWMVGTSVGGMIALGLAYGTPISRLKSFFTDDAQWVFTIRNTGDYLIGSNNASTPSNRPNAAQILKFILNDEPYYQSISETSNYGSAKLKSILVDVFSTKTLADLKSKVLVSAYEMDTDTPVLFSNYLWEDYRGQPKSVFNPDTGNYEMQGNYESLVNVALATSAAPVYLPEVFFNGHRYGDGGLYANNLIELGISLGKQIHPTANRHSILSIGSGLNRIGFYEKAAENLDPSVWESVLSGLFSWSLVDWTKTYRAVTRLKNLIGISITGSQEAAAKAVEIRSKANVDINDLINYCRMQEILDQTKDCSLDNVSADVFAYYKTEADNYFNQNIDRIRNFHEKLMI